MRLAFLIALLVLLIVILIRLLKKVWNLFQKVPNVTSSEVIRKILLQELHLHANDVFIDLGAGDGILLDLVQKKFPEATCIGYENEPDVYQQALAYKEKQSGTYTLYDQDLLSADLTQATHVYCYLMPHLMKKVAKKISAECTPGTLIFANQFPLPKRKPLLTSEDLVEGQHPKRLFLYKL